MIRRPPRKRERITTASAKQSSKFVSPEGHETIEGFSSPVGIPRPAGQVFASRQCQPPLRSARSGTPKKDGSRSSPGTDNALATESSRTESPSAEALSLISNRGGKGRSRGDHSGHSSRRRGCLSRFGYFQASSNRARRHRESCSARLKKAVPTARLTSRPPRYSGNPRDGSPWIKQGSRRAAFRVDRLEVLERRRTVVPMAKPAHAYRGGKKYLSAPSMMGRADCH